MYERFTDRSRNAMRWANLEAQRFHHEYIGTEHILLGLIAEASNGPPPPDEKTIGRVDAVFTVLFAPLARFDAWLAARIPSPASQQDSPDFLSARDIFNNLHVEARQIRREVEKILQSGTKTLAGRLPQTPPAKKVIEYAMEEARSLDHHAITTAHMLVGLLREEQGIAAQVLVLQGVTPDKVREEIRRMELERTEPLPG